MAVSSCRDWKEGRMEGEWTGSGGSEDQERGGRRTVLDVVTFLLFLSLLFFRSAII